MSLPDAFAPAEMVYRERLLEATWGHLAPVKNRRYSGRIVFVTGIYGDEENNPTTLYCKLSNKTLGDLPDSPWFYDFLQDWYFEQVDADLLTPGVVYEFKGSFFNYKFAGKIRALANYGGTA